MEKKQILKGNLLIAEFLGFTQSGFLMAFEDPEEYPVKGWKSIYNPDGSDFAFHKSFDKLQRPLKIIEEEYWVFTSVRKNKEGISRTETSIVTNGQPFERLVRTQSADKLEAMWLAVVEFIELLKKV